jgi:hypothetical protein
MITTIKQKLTDAIGVRTAAIRCSWNSQQCRRRRNLARRRHEDLLGLLLKAAAIHQ